jgi:hypothetical protein
MSGSFGAYNEAVERVRSARERVDSLRAELEQAEMELDDAQAEMESARDEVSYQFRPFADVDDDDFEPDWMGD